MPWRVYLETKKKRREGRERCRVTGGEKGGEKRNYTAVRATNAEKLHRLFGETRTESTVPGRVKEGEKGIMKEESNEPHHKTSRKESQ